MPRQRRLVKSHREPYPRERGSLLAKHALFPQLSPPMPEPQIVSSARAAFRKSSLTRSGDEKDISSTPEELARAALRHLKERTDPIDGVVFFSSIQVEDVFQFDAIFHEMHRHKMQMGDFYHQFILELMNASRTLTNSCVESANPGPREGDIIIDLKTPGFSRGLCVYGSVKKSADTVGGQDFGGAVKRLEKVAHEDQGRKRPHLCAFIIGNPIRGILRSYKDSRYIRSDRQKHPYSENGEVWEPGFIFPYLTGRSALDVFRISMGQVGDFLPYYTLQHKEAASRLLVDELRRLGLVNTQGRLDRNAFLEYVSEETQED